jgi:osmotically-inducible protein OsmY
LGCNDIRKVRVRRTKDRLAVDLGIPRGLLALVLPGAERRRRTALFIAGNVLGVLGVQDDIYLDTPNPYAGDVQDSIKKALERDAKLDSDSISVETVDGTTILSGNVRSWAEHDAAVAAAWAAPGVAAVDDRLSIYY